MKKFVVLLLCFVVNGIAAQTEMNQNIKDSLYTVYFNKGLEDMANKNYAAAVDAYTKAIGFKPTDADAYNNRGNARTKLFQYSEAIADYNKAIELDGKHALAYGNRGYAKLSIKDYAGGVSDYNKAIEYSEEPDIEYYYFRGVGKSAMLSYKEAIDDFTKVLELDNTYPMAYYMRAVAKQASNDLQGAKEDFTKAIEFHSNFINADKPKHGEAYFNRAVILIQQNDKINACADLGKAGELGYAKAYELISKHCK